MSILTTTTEHTSQPASDAPAGPAPRLADPGTAVDAVLGIGRRAPDTLYRGLPSTGTGDRVLVQQPDGHIRPLQVFPWSGPAGVSWGHNGHGARNLALSLLADALGEAARCPHCRGTSWVVYLDLPGEQNPALLTAPRYVPWTFDVDPDPARVAACPDRRCVHGLRPLPHEPLVRDILARLTPGRAWTLARADLLAWLPQIGWDPPTPNT